MLDLMKVPSPCYVVEESLLRRNLSLIKSVGDCTGVEIILAFKAFALWKLFPIFREYIHHAASSSEYESRLAFEEFGNKSYTYSPAYTEENFPEFLKYSSHITFNSLSQFERFYPMTKCAEEPVSCGIRINPEYSEVKTDLYNPCAEGSRFGVTADLLPEYLPKGIEGFHCHCLCESDSYEMERTLEHIEKKISKWFSQIKWLNLGGGHLMTREGYDIEHLIFVLKSFRKRYPHLQIILEPGSAFVWQTGGLIATVVDIVNNHKIQTAILDVSFACHMPDCLEMPYQPKIRDTEIQSADAVTKSSEDYIYRIGGNSCLSGDYMGSWKFDHKLQVGERILFEDMIHYTTVKTNMFNGIHHPSIALLHINGDLEILKSFYYEDYRNRMC